MLKEIKKEENTFFSLTTTPQIKNLSQDDEFILLEVILADYNSSLKSNDNIYQKFYNLPRYYDIAFNRDITNDIRFFEYCFQRYSDINVKSILEPACGPGMFLESIPKYGYYIIGYDLSPAMVEYTKEKLRISGLTIEQVDVLEGDMKDLKFDKKFDAAFICINSLGYLRSNDDICSHFRIMAETIKFGGIYIVEISCKCDNILNERKWDDIWYVKDDDVELELSWIINRYDEEHRIRHVDFRMVIKENGNEMLIEEAHDLRLWIFDEFKNFVNSNGFEIVGIYNQNYESVSQNIPITGELGALFIVLKNKCIISK